MTVQTSQAELLRLRLKVAMYKVRTNQINTPFARLRVHGPSLARAAAYALERLDPAILARERGADEANVSAHARLMASVALEARDTPVLQPAPLLVPTAYSSRMVYGPPLLQISGTEVLGPREETEGTEAGMLVREDRSSDLADSSGLVQFDAT